MDACVMVDQVQIHVVYRDCGGFVFPRLTGFMGSEITFFTIHRGRKPFTFAPIKCLNFHLFLHRQIDGELGLCRAMCMIHRTPYTSRPHEAIAKAVPAATTVAAILGGSRERDTPPPLFAHTP